MRILPKPYQVSRTLFMQLLIKNSIQHWEYYQVVCQNSTRTIIHIIQTNHQSRTLFKTIVIQEYYLYPHIFEDPIWLFENTMMKCLLWSHSQSSVLLLSEDALLISFPVICLITIKRIENLGQRNKFQNLFPYQVETRVVFTSVVRKGTT